VCLLLGHQGVVERVSAAGLPPDSPVVDVLADGLEHRVCVLGRLGGKAFADGIDDGEPGAGVGEGVVQFGRILEGDDLDVGVGDPIEALQLGQEPRRIGLELDARSAGGPGEDDADAGRRLSLGGGVVAVGGLGSGRSGSAVGGSLVESLERGDDAGDLRSRVVVVEPAAEPEEPAGAAEPVGREPGAVLGLDEGEVVFVGGGTAVGGHPPPGHFLEVPVGEPVCERLCLG
jgi:hypothetical protein